MLVKIIIYILQMTKLSHQEVKKVAHSAQLVNGMDHPSSAPAEHMQLGISYTSPKYMIVANTFSCKSYLNSTELVFPRIHFRKHCHRAVQGMEKELTFIYLSFYCPLLINFLLSTLYT